MGEWGRRKRGGERRTGHLPLGLIVEGAPVRELGAVVENLGGRERREGNRDGGRELHVENYRVDVL